jgi:hypothetical protein
VNPPPVLRYLLWGLGGLLAVAAVIAILPLVLFSGPFALAVKVTALITIAVAHVLNRPR